MGVSENTIANESMDEVAESAKGKRSYLFDILAAILWIVLMWGFLALLTFTDSPKDHAGTHELLAYTYFLGFTFVYAIFYIIALKRGV